MTSITLSTSMRIGSGMTLTSGFSARIISVPDSTLGRPTFAVVWRIWRWRFDTSTTSPSMSPIVPTPAAARYTAVGEPSPPAPISSTLERSSLRWPFSPTWFSRKCRL